MSQNYYFVTPRIARSRGIPSIAFLLTVQAGIAIDRYARRRLLIANEDVRFC